MRSVLCSRGKRAKNLDIRKLISNLSLAAISQVVSLSLSVTVSLLIPKVLSIDEFGYWQLFTFYTSYVGFFHLGLNDGVYLINGGKTRKQVDQRSINSQFAFGLALQTVFAAIIVAIAFSGNFASQRQFVICSTAVFLLLNNSTMFMGYVFQALNETKLYSRSVIIDKLSFLLPLVILLSLHITNFRFYVFFYGIAKTCSLLFCLWNYREFLKSGLEPVKTACHDTFYSISVGVRLMLANITGFLILGVIRFLADARWGISTFSRLSFAISLVNFIMTAISQISMVLFPALRQSNKAELKNIFVVMQRLLSVLLPLIYLLYFPVVMLLSKWLPEYTISFYYFALLLPLIIFNGKMDIIGSTFIKVLRKETYLLFVNFVTLVISSAGAVLGAFVFLSIPVMIGGSVIAFVLRSLFTEHLVSSYLDAGWNSLDIGLILLTLIFYGTISTCTSPVAFAIILLTYIVFLFIYRKDCHAVVIDLKHVRDKVVLQES